ncbi:MAG: universal stress protein [Nitrospirae bacterium]|nr:universal stress protein [Nitrospirota bacterium]
MNILLPIDGSDYSKRALKFAGFFVASLGKTIERIGLLRVVTGRYMKSHIPFFDFRSEILKQSDSFKKFKQRHIDLNIKPSLDEGEKILKEAGISIQVEKFISEGEPSNEIIRLAEEKDFSIIIMARRGISELTGIILGSVTNKVIHHASKQTVYIVGQKIPHEITCPVRKILIPVDGSPYSIKGVEHGAFLAKSLSKFIENITLLRVINLAFYETKLLEGVDLEEEAKKILDEAKQILLKNDIHEGIITIKIRVGNPADEILKEADEHNHDTILLGRKGRTAFKDFILGGVSSTVMQRCIHQTVVIISST